MTCGAILWKKGDKSYSGIKGNPQSFTQTRCSRKGKYRLIHLTRHQSFCKTHKRMALEGLISSRGYVECPQDIANIRKYDMPPPHEGVWEEVLPAGTKVSYKLNGEYEIEGEIHVFRGHQTGNGPTYKVRFDDFTSQQYYFMNLPRSRLTVISDV